MACPDVSRCDYACLRRGVCDHQSVWKAGMDQAATLAICAFDDRCRLRSQNLDWDEGFHAGTQAAAKAIRAALSASPAGDAPKALAAAARSSAVPSPEVEAVEAKRSRWQDFLTEVGKAQLALSSIAPSAWYRLGKYRRFYRDTAPTGDSAPGWIRLYSAEAIAEALSSSNAARDRAERERDELRHDVERQIAIASAECNPQHQEQATATPTISNPDGEASHG